jgi:hypothetical protein
MCFITPFSHPGGAIDATTRYARPQLELISRLNPDLRRARSARSTPRLNAELNYMFLCYEKIRTCYSAISVCTVDLVYINATSPPHAISTLPTLFSFSVLLSTLPFGSTSCLLPTAEVRQSTMSVSTKILVNERRAATSALPSCS